jgi:hypothetical protein
MNNGIVSLIINAACVAIWVIAMLKFRNDLTTPGYWEPAEIRRRGREARRYMLFGCSIAVMLVFSVTAFYRDPIWFTWWATVCAVIALFIRPQCMRRARRASS